MRLTDLDPEQRQVLDRDYRANGMATLTGVPFPSVFVPARLDLIFLSVDGTCEVYISDRAKYAGGHRRWQRIFASSPLPGGARLLLANRGDWVTAFTRLLAELNESHEASVAHAADVGPSVADAAAVLGVHPSASAAAVKSAFRQKAKLIHPDRQTSASSDERAAAEVETRKLIEAYKFLTRSETTVPTY